MCGFIGVFDLKERNSDRYGMEELLRLIRHRGPDDKNIYTAGNGELTVGFVRLSIIDLDAGSQPVFNEDKSISAVLNGEIYNYIELREKLQARGHVFRSKSDTEVIVHLYEEYGIGMIERLQGMFAIALWDQNKKSLFLIRDRMGIKPLYYSMNGKMLAFASEIKPLLRLPFVSSEVSIESACRFLNYEYVPGPATLFKDIFKMMPGHYFCVTEDGVTETCYWDCNEIIPAEGGAEQIRDQIMQSFDEAIALHLRSDVPLGAFLSGGIDSGLIVARAANMVSGLNTYTLRFEGAPFDESPMAELIAEKFHTRHHCYTVGQQSLKALIPEMLWYCDEPLGDSGLLPNYLLNEMVKKDGIKVILSGAGGDELFAGYTYYFQRPFEKILSGGRAAIKLGEKILERYAGDLAGRLARSVSFDSDRAAYLIGYKTAICDEKVKNLIRIPEYIPDQHLHDYFKAFKGDPLNACEYVDIKTYLADDLMLLADRTCMAHSIEGRMPFLHHPLVEMALSIPQEIKAPQQRRKQFLIDIARQFLPEEILSLPKQGFCSPLQQWSAGGFTSLEEKVLTSARCLERGLWNSDGLRRCIQKMTVSAQDANQRYLLFVLEMFLRVHIDNQFDSAGSINIEDIYG